MTADKIEYTHTTSRKCCRWFSSGIVLSDYGDLREGVVYCLLRWNANPLYLGKVRVCSPAGYFGIRGDLCPYTAGTPAAGVNMNTIRDFVVGLRANPSSIRGEIRYLLSCV